MYDVFYLSYKDHNETNLNQLKQFVPIVKKIENIKGIWQAHNYCANQARTKFFFVVDADCYVRENIFDTKGDENYVQVFRSFNPVNGLTYGWGGIKLFPTNLVKETKIPEKYLDMTTSWNTKPLDIIASENRFNVDAFSTWRSAYRETTKIKYWINCLLNESWKELQFFSWIKTKEQFDKFLFQQQERLNVWSGFVYSFQYFSEYCLQGAQQALKDYNLENIHMINDRDYLERKFNEIYLLR